MSETVGEIVIHTAFKVVKWTLIISVITFVIGGVIGYRIKPSQINVDSAMPQLGVNAQFARSYRIGGCTFAATVELHNPPVYRFHRGNIALIPAPQIKSDQSTRPGSTCAPLVGQADQRARQEVTADLLGRFHGAQGRSLAVVFES
jgi:hypothetical protein